MKKITHALEFAGVRFALWSAAMLPDTVARGIGAFAGSLAFDFLRIRRSVAVENVRRALNVDMGHATRIARASYRNLGRTMFEWCAFRRLTTEQLQARIDFTGLEHIDAARELGKGAIIVSGHMGHWELPPAGLATAGYPINGIVGEQTNKRVDGVISDLRRKQGIELIARGVALKKVLRALAKNELIFLLSDQDARKGGVFIEFLGRPASAVRGPAMFAAKSGSPIIPFFVNRLKGIQHTITFEPPLWPDRSLDAEEMIVDLTQRTNDRLAERIRRYPEEYFWAHRRWKTQPPQ